MRPKSHGFELAGVHTRGLENSQTEVRSIPSLSSDRSGPMGHYSGQLKIAEVSSRFENVDQFVSLISLVGFKFKSKVYT